MARNFPCSSTRFCPTPCSWVRCGVSANFPAHVKSPACCNPGAHCCAYAGLSSSWHHWWPSSTASLVFTGLPAGRSTDKSSSSRRGMTMVQPPLSSTAVIPLPASGVLKTRLPWIIPEHPCATLSSSSSTKTPAANSFANTLRSLPLGTKKNPRGPCTMPTSASWPVKAQR